MSTPVQPKYSTRKKSKPKTKSERLKQDGMQIPWITRWTAEADDWTVVSQEYRGYHFRRRSEATQREGEPQFANTHSGRSWFSMVDNLCQICGLRGANIWRTWGEFDQRQVTTETPIHPQCLQIALHQCPHLLQARGKVRGHEYQWWHCDELVVIGGLWSPLRVSWANPHKFGEEPKGWVLRAPWAEITPREPWAGVVSTPPQPPSRRQR